MSERRAICIVIDGLRASALGAYGNTTNATPRLDKLASRSNVVEWLWADAPRLDDFYRTVWQSKHALRIDPSADSTAVLELLGQAGVERRLITDAAEVIEQPDSSRFDKVVSVLTAAESPAEDLSETTLGQFCSAAVERLEDSQGDFADSITWLHTRGLFGPWDAPSDLRTDQLDEEDPPAAEYLWPPSALRDVSDPDELLVHRAAYAAQVAVVDACVGALCQSIEELSADSETLLVLLGSRGFALGEHGNIGGECCELFGERLHLPWLLHVCGNKIPRPRLPGLAQPADVGGALLEWFGLGAGNDASSGRAVLCSRELRQLAVSAGDEGERAIRTPAWLLRQPAGDSPPQLYVKPDDRWEANDVASRCPQIVERLSELLSDFEQRCREGRPLPDEPLDSELVAPRR